MPKTKKYLTYMPPDTRQWERLANLVARQHVVIVSCARCGAPKHPAAECGRCRPEDHVAMP